MQAALETPTLRHGTDDGAMWQSVYEDNEYGLTADKVAGAVVLDIGGGVGAFAAKCLALGAEHVTSVEPNAETCRVYRANLRDAILDGRASLVCAGAWSCRGEGTLRLYDGGVRSGDTLVFSPPGEDVGCRLVDFAAMCRAFVPDVVKVDCEGSEYELFRGDKPFPLLPTVRRLWVEFHGTLHQPWQGNMDAVIGLLRLAGYSGVQLTQVNGNKLFEFVR